MLYLLNNLIFGYLAFFDKKLLTLLSSDKEGAQSDLEYGDNDSCTKVNTVNDSMKVHYKVTMWFNLILLVSFALVLLLKIFSLAAWALCPIKKYHVTKALVGDSLIPVVSE